jgi:hypothetical protein
MRMRTAEERQEQCKMSVQDACIPSRSLSLGGKRFLFWVFSILSGLTVFFFLASREPGVLVILGGSSLGRAGMHGSDTVDRSAAPVPAALPLRTRC